MKKQSPVCTPPLRLHRCRRTLKLAIPEGMSPGNALCAPHGFKLGLNSGGVFCLAPDAQTPGQYVQALSPTVSVVKCRKATDDYITKSPRQTTPDIPDWDHWTLYGSAQSP